MNIEDLTKSQLLLLTIMVNFVVAIATAVLTVSLLDEAPLTVTQTVDRIVERTVEAVATPIQVVSPGKPATQTQEQLLTSAVTASLARSALIHRNSTTSPAIAFGTYLPRSRAVVTAQVSGLPKEAIIAFADGSSAQASLSKTGSGIAIYGFADDEELPEAPAAGLPATKDLKQGQTVIGITKDTAALTGIISKVDGKGIQTSLPAIPVGSGVVDLSGLVIGIGSPNAGTLLTADAISALLTQATPVR